MDDEHNQDPGTGGETGQGPGEGAAPQDWRNSLPEPLREAPFIKAADDPEKALQEIQNAASYMGNALRIPGEDASEEDRVAFYEKLQEKVPGLMPKPSDDNLEELYKFLRPESPDQYSFDAPEGREVPEDFEAFSKIAHKHGLSKDQFKGILNDLLGPQWEQQDQLSAEQTEAMKALGKEWGAAYEQNLTTVKNFLRLTDAPEGIVELLSQGAMSPEEIKWIHSVARATKSEAEIANQGNGDNPAMISPDEAQARISEIMNNPSHAYWNAADPSHDRAVRKVVELHKFKSGDRSADPSLI
jgi:hypothetical protein